MQADSCHVGRSTLHSPALLQFKLLTQVARSHTGMEHIALLTRHHTLQPYPIAAPTRLRQQPYAETLRLAPGGLTLIGIDLHLPCAEHTALQLFASVGYPQLFVRCHLARVPQLTLVATYDNLVGRLLHVILPGCSNPRETGGVCVEPQWVCQVFNLEATNAHHGLRLFLFLGHANHRQQHQ